MVNFPKVGTVRLSKLFFHSILLTIFLTFLFLLVTDLLSLALGYRIEKDTSYVSVFIVIWILYALQNDRYK